MKRLIKLMSVGLVLLGLSGVANAYIINYDYATMAGGNSFTSPYSGVTVYTFDAGGPVLNWTKLSGEAGVVNGTVEFSYQAPNGLTVRDTTDYFNVRPYYPPSGPGIDGSIKASFGSNYNYLGIWWGSMDWYNSIAFYNGATQVAYFNGDAVAYADPGTNCYAPDKCADGDTTRRGTNHYVNFLNLPDFNSFIMTSSLCAFEADNIAVGVIPEPSSMLLFGLGLLGLAGLRRKFKK